MIPRWLLRWRNKAPAKSDLPFGLSATEVASLRQLVASPQWRHYIRVLDAVAEQQAGELASGLPHDRYLFVCGALVALRRVYTLVDDLLVSATNIQELTDARFRTDAERNARASSTFLNTPWYAEWSAARKRGVEGG